MPTPSTSKQHYIDDPVTEGASGSASCSPCWERGYNFSTGHQCECGGDLYIADNADGAIYDGDEYECCECGDHGAMTVYEDGEVSPMSFGENDPSADTGEAG